MKSLIFSGSGLLMAIGFLGVLILIRLLFNKLKKTKLALEVLKHLIIKNNLPISLINKISVKTLCSLREAILAHYCKNIINDDVDYAATFLGKSVLEIEKITIGFNKGLDINKKFLFKSLLEEALSRYPEELGAILLKAIIIQSMPVNTKDEEVRHEKVKQAKSLILEMITLERSKGINGLFWIEILWKKFDQEIEKVLESNFCNELKMDIAGEGAKIRKNYFCFSLEGI
ncbi:MAG: hypothetical protein MUF50_02190 [Planctomycetes bacterium]|jgi:hypothetical protein|nr:hypothetical protein [Planctomycetota bacterium]